MQELIASLEGFSFTFEDDVRAQRGTGLLPFQGMDKSGAAVCTFFSKGLCGKGKRCPFRHDTGGRTVVCKHWLRGLCKKGDQCKFLHQYDTSRMPECYFYSKFGDCSNKECPFLHMKPAAQTQACPWYDQGFCKDGPRCKYRHVHRVMCVNYLAGFCPDGPKCRLAHPKLNPFLFSPSYMEGGKWSRTSAPPAAVVEPPWAPPRSESLLPGMRTQESLLPACLELWPLQQVLCYRCRKMGHYANWCPEAHLMGLIPKQPLAWGAGRPFGDSAELPWDCVPAGLQQARGHPAQGMRHRRSRLHLDFFPTAL
ncbi:putative cleavage and polyadenylation specificity factor subunit 4-like protein [Tenrec ecaudatus]|uniref:putative cleavage and polyadenylation specificity factor subunit 4-like protein n=1 Tax=Tenrec ecaudatus TaxID=94439 RepID=UPI003F5A7F8C